MSFLRRIAHITVMHYLLHAFSCKSHTRCVEDIRILLRLRGNPAGQGPKGYRPSCRHEGCALEKDYQPSRLTPRPENLKPLNPKQLNPKP